MLQCAKANYFDGLSPQPQTGILVFNSFSNAINYYSVIDGQEKFLFSLNKSYSYDLRKMGGEYRLEWRRKSNYSSELLTFTDDDLSRAIREKFLGNKNWFWRLATYVWTEPPVKIIIPLTVVFLGLFALAYLAFFHSYLLFPKKWDAAIADQLENKLKLWGIPCQSPDTEKKLMLILDYLKKPDSPYHYQLTLYKSDMNNIFALPGGRIVFFTKSINQAGSYAELAGILAHEIGHVEYRHGIQQLNRYLTLRLVLALVLGIGDESVLLSGAFDAGVLLLLLKYSRNQESEADSYAANLLLQKGISNEPLRNFFKRQSAKQNSKENIDLPGFFRTHPQDIERIGFFEKFEANHINEYNHSVKAKSRGINDLLKKTPSLDKSCK